MRKNDVWQLIISLLVVPMVCMFVLAPTNKNISEVRAEQKEEQEQKNFFEEKIENYLEGEWGCSIESIPHQLIVSN